jgi:hypothetical protein
LVLEVPHNIRDFDTRVGLERTECRGKERRPRRDALSRGTGTNDVYSGRLDHPRFSDIVDLRLSVRRDPRRLDCRFASRREVSAGTKEHICWKPFVFQSRKEAVDAFYIVLFF